MAYHHIKLQVPGSSGSLVIAIVQKINFIKLGLRPAVLKLKRTDRLINIHDQACMQSFCAQRAINT
jgi:hypothetical protein